MSANNNNWVCFECQIVLREPKSIDRTPTCPECREDCYCLGYKVAVPKKTDKKAWLQLRQECRNREYERIERNAKARVARQHDLERRIARLQSHDENPGRIWLIKELKLEVQKAKNSVV